MRVEANTVPVVMRFEKVIVSGSRDPFCVHTICEDRLEYRPRCGLPTLTWALVNASEVWLTPRNANIETLKFTCVAFARISEMISSAVPFDDSVKLTPL